MNNNDLMEYKGYYGSVKVDMKEKILHGKIEFISDLVTFEAAGLPDLEKEFRSAVDDYLETCASLGVAAEKAFSGTFNVRPGKERHRNMAVLAKKNGVSLNEEMNRAIDGHLTSAAR